MIWTTTAPLLWLRTRPGALATGARLLAVAAPFAMLSYGCVTRVGGSWVGLAYLPGAALLAILLANLFAREREPGQLRPTGNVRVNELTVGPPSTRGAT